MNNEDKIITMLINLSTDMADMKQEINQRFDRLEAGQAELKAGQEAMAKEVKAIREQTEHLTEFEAETRKSLSELNGVTSINSFDIASLRHKVS